MATAKQQQEAAAQRVQNMDADIIHCRHCGEQSVSGSFKGYVHQWGARGHLFMARKP